MIDKERKTVFIDGVEYRKVEPKTEKHSESFIFTFPPMKGKRDNSHLIDALRYCNYGVFCYDDNKTKVEPLPQEETFMNVPTNNILDFADIIKNKPGIEIHYFDIVNGHTQDRTIVLGYEGEKAIARLLKLGLDKARRDSLNLVKYKRPNAELTMKVHDFFKHKIGQKDEKISYGILMNASYEEARAMYEHLHEMRTGAWPIPCLNKDCCIYVTAVGMEHNVCSMKELNVTYNVWMEGVLK